MVTEKIKKLIELKHQCFSCTRCDIGRHVVQNKYNPHVFSYGSVKDNVIVFVAQNPGLSEIMYTVDGVLKPRPLVGRAGQVFMKMVNYLGFVNRDYVYSTNVVKCYTPNNRAPSVDEVQNCLFFLEREIEILKPRIIVALGNFALNVLTGKSGIMMYHGNVLKSEKFKCLVYAMCHPAACLHNPNNRQIMIDDVKKLKEIINNSLL